MTRDLSADAAGLRDAAQAFLKTRPDLSALDLSQYTTVGDSSIRNFINGHHPGGAVVESELRRVLDLARAGDILAPGSNGHRPLVLAERPTERVRRVLKTKKLYQTETVARVAEVLDYCVENCAIGVITADFGAGKTEAAAAWRRKNIRNVESLVFEFDEFTAHSKPDFVRGLARSLTDSIDTSGGFTAGGRMFCDLVDYLKEHPTLLIFDQCETLRPRIFQIIRQLWDRTNEAGVGIALLAAPILLTRMNHSKMADLGALMSRVGVWAPLAGVSKQEMAAIVKQEGITDVEEAAFDLWWKATGGSMRRLMRAIDMLKSKHAGKRVTERTVTGIAGHLWGVEVAA